MKLVLFMGSPRKNGNTAALVAPFLEECGQLGIETETVWLYDKTILPCLGCKTCQDRMDGLGCVQKDDVANLFGTMECSDIIVLATPIYGWFCTAPMKALMDRAVYAGTKNYGRVKGPSLLQGKNLAAIVTCGYPPEKGADLWEAGLRRWCRHSGLHWQGMLCGRDMGPGVPFLTQDKLAAARDFARSLFQKAGGEDL